MKEFENFNKILKEKDITKWIDLEQSTFGKKTQSQVKKFLPSVASMKKTRIGNQEIILFKNSDKEIIGRWEPPKREGASLIPARLYINIERQ